MKRPIAITALLASAAAPAQETPQTIQGLDNFSIERPAPPRPDAAATPVPVPAAPVIGLPTPVPAPTRNPARQARQNVPAPAASPSIAPVTSPTPGVSAVTPAVEAAPEPAPAAEATAPPAAGQGWSWWWALGLLLLAGVGSAFALWWRSRGELAAAEQSEPVVVAVPVPAEPPPPEAVAAAPVPAPSPPSAPAGGGFITSGLRAVIELDFRPVRAVIDTLRVALEYELSVANTGATTSRALFVELMMLSAGTSQDAALAEFLAAPPGEPIAESDGLAAGGIARLGGETLRARDAFDLITAGNKRMIVPLVAVRVLGPTGVLVAKAAWLVGIERAGEARMAPLRLDGRAVQEGLGFRAYP